MKKQYIAVTANHKNVYVDLEGSHAATHLSDTPQLMRLVQELLSTVVAEKDNQEIQPNTSVKEWPWDSSDAT